MSVLSQRIFSVLELEFCPKDPALFVRNEMICEIEGFVQFRSPIFTVGASNNILVKVTTCLNCLCTEPIYNVLITYKSEEGESSRGHREAFIASLDGWMHQRVRFHGLNRATLFSGRVTLFWHDLKCYSCAASLLEYAHNIPVIIL